MAIKNEPSKEDMALLGKLFVDYVSNQGIPTTPIKLLDQKMRLSKALEVSEEKIIELYYLLFDLSVKIPMSDSERNKIGFKSRT